MKLGHARLGIPDASAIDHRIAVSEQARASADALVGGPCEVVPNGVLIPDHAEPGTASTVVFIGRHEPRKGLHVLLRAWPEIRRRTGARLR